jgi:hypothetical protein
MPIKDKYGRQMANQPKFDTAMKRFRDHINLDDLQLALGENPKYTKFLKMLVSPDFANYSFSKIARTAGVTLHELQSLYTDGKRQLALIQVSNDLPRLMNDVTGDAFSRDTPCPRCNGEGEELARSVDDDEPGYVQCKECGGKGTITVPGDRHARDLVFESTGLKGKGSGININLGQQINLGEGSDRIEELLSKTQTVVLETSDTKQIKEVEDGD